MPEENNTEETDQRLITAVQNKDLKNVARALDEGANPDTCDENGSTVLATAVGKQYLDIFHALLEAGANPNDKGQDNWLSLPPLALAFNNDDITAMIFLLESNANPNVKNIDGLSLLEVAVFEQDEKKVKVLLSYDANPLTQNNPPLTAVDYAAMGDNEGIKQMLNDYVVGNFVPLHPETKEETKDSEPRPYFTTPLPKTFDVDSLIRAFDKEYLLTQPLPPKLFSNFDSIRKEPGPPIIR